MSNNIGNKTIFGKYKISKILGRGSFGFVYKGKNVLTGENVAIKLEDYKSTGNILESEAYFLFALKNIGIPEVKSFGICGKYKLLVQTLLGDSLEVIFNNKRCYLPMQDICKIAIQLLDRLEFIHSKYVIHRDIKPDNILVDLETKRIIYLIDFGLAKKYRSGRTKKHILFTVPKRLTGTARYASVNALRGTEQSRRDDLESAGYVFIYFAQKGELPWQGLNVPDKLERYREIYKIKKRIKPEELCKGLPKEFCDYIKYVKGLQFEQDPDYNYLKGLFLNILNRIGFNNIDFHFSWMTKHEINNMEKDKIILHSRNGSINKKKTSPQARLYRNIQTRLGRNIQTSQEKEKNMENINKEKLLSELEEKQEQREKESIIRRKNEKLKKFKEEKSLYENSKNEKDCEILSDKDGTQITQYNKSVNVEEIDEEIKNNEKSNDLIIKQGSMKEKKRNLNINKKIILQNKNENGKIDSKEKDNKNIGYNTIHNRPINFDLAHGSFSDAPLIKCLSQHNIKNIFIDNEKVHNSGKSRNSINKTILTEDFIQKNIISKDKNNGDIDNNNKNTTKNTSNNISPKKITTNITKNIKIKLNEYKQNNLKKSKNICKSEENKEKCPLAGKNIYKSPINNIKNEMLNRNNIKSNLNNNNLNNIQNNNIRNLKRINLNQLNKINNFNNNNIRHYDIKKHFQNINNNINNNNIGHNNRIEYNRDEYIRNNKGKNISNISFNSLSKSNSKNKNINTNIRIKLIMQKSEDNIFKKSNKYPNQIKTEAKSSDNGIRKQRNMGKRRLINNLSISGNKNNWKINNNDFFNIYNSNSKDNKCINNRNIINNNDISILNPNKTINIYKKDSNIEKTKMKTIKLYLNKIRDFGLINKDSYRKNYYPPNNNYNNNIYNNAYINSTKNNYNFNIINNNNLINPNIRTNIFYANSRNLNNNNINITLNNNSLYRPEKYNINFNKKNI